MFEDKLKKVLPRPVRIHNAVEVSRPVVHRVGRIQRNLQPMRVAGDKFELHPVIRIERPGNTVPDVDRFPSERGAHHLPVRVANRFRPAIEVAREIERCIR